MHFCVRDQLKTFIDRVAERISASPLLPRQLASVAVAGVSVFLVCIFILDRLPGSDPMPLSESMQHGPVRLYFAI